MTQPGEYANDYIIRVSRQRDCGVMRRLLVAALVIVGVPAIWLAAVFVLFGNYVCQPWDTTLARDDRGRAVVSTFGSCAFAGNDQWVDLVSPSGHHERIFDFVPWEGVIDPRVREPFEPSATWVESNVLRMSIGTVDGIAVQRTEVDGVRVVYEIGANLDIGAELSR